MRVWLLLLLPLAGCLNESQDDSFPAVAGMVDHEVPVWMQDDYVMMDMESLPLYTLQLCDEGLRVVQFANEPSNNPTDRSCDFRVTKPLIDPDNFDWTTQHGPANEVSLAANPIDPFNLVGGGKDYTVSYISDVADCGQYTVWNGAYWSNDGGRTWGNDLIQGFPGDERPSPLQGNQCNTDPVIVFDSDGTVWHNGLNYRGAREDTGDPMNPVGNGGLVTGSQVFFARSQDGGASFDRITFASFGQNDPGIFNDKNWLAVDPDSDHMIHTWTNFYNGVAVIEYVESLDAGATWSAPAPISPGASGTQPNIPVGQFSMPQYDRDGNVHVIWSSSGGVVHTIGTRAEGVGPVTFEPTSRAFDYDAGLGGTGCLAETQFRASTYPVMGINTHPNDWDNRVFVTYPQAGDNGTGVFVRYLDGVWSEPIEVTAGLPNDQFMPWIEVDNRGRVHVAYYDCSAGNNMTVGYVYSLDGGDTWSAPMLIGQASFNGDLGHHQSGAPFIGDYIAVDSSCAGVHFMWADTRHTGEEGRLAGSDVYAATLALDWSAAKMYAPEVAPSPAGYDCSNDA